MKLIIDISEDYFETIKHKDGWNNVKPYNLIANGTPLDNLRAEIEENINYNKKMNYQGIVAGLLLTLDIIDKYRNEVSE